MSEEFLTPEEWEELFAETELEPAPPVFAYTNTDPYFKLQKGKQHFDCRMDEAGSINAPNFSAHFLPELNLRMEIHGTIYSVTGVYAGSETLDQKLERNLPKSICFEGEEDTRQE